MRNAAKALIIRDGCLLALTMRFEDGVFFILPGGSQEPGETPAAAVRRKRHSRRTLASDPAPGAGDRPDEGQRGPVWLPLARLPRTRLYPLGLRSLLCGAADEGCPVYLGDLE